MLNRSTVPLPVGGGVSEGDSDVAFDAPLLREAINARFPKIGQTAKRHGETAYATTGLPATATYGDHNSVAEQDGRPVIQTMLGAYLYDPARTRWESGGTAGPRPSSMRTDPLIRQNNSSQEPEIALVTVGGKTVACVVWGDVDLKDGFYAFAEIPTGGGPPRVLAGPTMFTGTRDMSSGFRLTSIGTTVYCIAKDLAGGDIWYASVDVNAGYAFSAPASVNPGWGAVASPLAFFNDGTDLFVVLDEGANSYSVRRLDTSFTQEAFEVVAREALDATLVGSTIAIICADGSLDTVATTIPGPPTNTVVTTPGASGPLFNAVTRGTISEAPSSGYFLVWERTSSVTPIENTGVVCALVSSGLAVTSLGTTGGVRLMTRAAYRSGDGVPLVGVVDDINPTVFRMGYIARPVTDVAGAYTLAEHARFGQDVLVRNTVAVSPSVLYDSASKQWLAPFVITADATTAAFATAVQGLNLLRCFFVDAPAERSVSANGLRAFAGGCGVTYTDGVVHAEVSPSPIGIVGNATADVSGVFVTGSGAVDTVAAKLAVRWRDERGNLHRSMAFAATISPWFDDGIPGDDEALRISIPRPFPATIRGDRGGQKYEVEVYAQNATDSLYYLNDVVTPAAHPTKPGIDYFLVSNNFSTHPISSGARPTGADYIADVNKSSGGAEYWGDTGELVHVPPPPMIDLVSTQARVWALSAENGRLDVFPSKLLTRGFAPEFPTALRIILPDEGGEAVALAALNDKVVVFKERLIYVIFGDPADNTGANSALQAPRLVQGDVGCANAQSVVEGPFGVVFRSSTGGFHLISAGLEVTRLPNVEDLLSSHTVTSGVLVADKKEVRWSLDDGTKALGRTLVWDYEANAWCSRTDADETACAAVVGGQYVRVAYGGTPYLSRDTWSTSLDSHEMKLTSAWIKPGNGLQAFARVWKTIYLLRWITGQLYVRVGYDYNPTFTDSRTFTAAELSALALSDGTVAIEVQHTIQKCRSFRFQIEEETNVGQDNYRGQGITLLGVQVELAAKRGSFARAMKQEARK